MFGAQIEEKNIFEKFKYNLQEECEVVTDGVAFFLILRVDNILKC